MKVLGIHDGHNATVCLFIDGEIVNVLQEERLRSIKNYSGFPEMAFKKVLLMNNLNIQNIDVFVYDFKHHAFVSENHNVIESYNKSNSFKSLAKILLKHTFVYKGYKQKRKSERVRILLDKGIPEFKIQFVEHHLAHASAAYWGAPWVKKDEKILILTQDGSGDGLSGTVSIGCKNKIKRIAEIKKEDSLGRLYANTTFMLGMVPLEHEYKLMGMAPYAPEKGKMISHDVFKEILEFSDDGLTWKRKKGLPVSQRMYPYLRDKTELHRFDWICAGIQQYTEDMLVQWVKNCIKKTGIGKIVLSGGTFMNVKANQRISELSEVENLFIFPSCGDESNAIGAAYHVYYNQNSNKQSPGIRHLYYGPDETDKENCLKHINDFSSKTKIEFEYEYYEDIEKKVADLLTKGEIVARCKGPMEFGARALGNRSILSDASDLSKINIINEMIKKRDFWMPFAPVILEERANEYIKNPKNINSYFMIITFDSTNKYKEFIGGVQQVDKTTRPQIVNENLNNDYYRILKNYESNTGKGILINTSFNLHGLPIVYGPKEALYVFENSGLEYLALGNFIVKKTINV